MQMSLKPIKNQYTYLLNVVYMCTHVVSSIVFQLKLNIYKMNVEKCCYLSVVQEVSVYF